MIKIIIITITILMIIIEKKNLKKRKKNKDQIKKQFKTTVNDHRICFYYYSCYLYIIFCSNHFQITAILIYLAKTVNGNYEIK